MVTGKFITFEGGEGSGKSTQSKLLVKYLKSQNIDAIWTREIGGTDTAEKIRSLVLFEEFLPISELLLIMAARSEHINKMIKPALEKGTWVICDRFIDSTACYQSINDNLENDLSIERIYQLHERLLNSFLPDITFYLKLKPEIALKRAIDRGDNNKFELKGLEFHKQVFENFNQINELNKFRIIDIDAEQKLEFIEEQIKTHINKFLFN